MKENERSKHWILCFDCGDTLVDEGTQVFDENGDVLSAEPLPGAVKASCTGESSARTCSRSALSSSSSFSS